MSPSAYITKRTTEKSGPRFVVRFRIGGRYSKLIHAGSFRTLKHAKIRRDFVIAELSAGRNPIETLRALGVPSEIVTLTTWFDRFIATRIDVGDATRALYRNARDKLGRLADMDPAAVKPSDVQQWIADNEKLAPKTVRHYLSSIRQVIDFADIEPNPARSRKIRIPALDRKEPSPPSAPEFLALLEKIPERFKLPVRLMECVALRVGETCQLTWGDVDLLDSRLRISRARTKGGTAGQRWLPLPVELLMEIDELLPLEDRHPDRTVFTFTDAEMRRVIERACKLAGIAHYHPHDLRHRRISLWVAHGIDPITVKTWAGHSNASMSLDTYAHVIAGSDEWQEFWIDLYVRERETRVRSRQKPEE